MATKKVKQIKNVSFPSIESRGITDFLDQLQENLQSVPSMLFDKSIPYTKLGERVITSTTGSDIACTAFTFPGSIHDAGDFTSSSNLKADDGNEAAKPSTPVVGDCTVDNFGFAVPVTATITQIRIRAQWRLSSPGTGSIRARWTKDGGSNWTTILQSATEGTITLGTGALSTWGGTYSITPAQANDNDNFQVQLYASSDSSINYVDYVAVEICYTGSGETTSITTYNMAAMPVDATAGSVMFAATGSDPYLEEDNTNLFWDNTNKRLGIKKNTPSATLDVDGAAIFNDSGAAVDFRIEGDTNANLLFIDGSADFIGIGHSAPATILDIDSNSNTSALRIRGATFANEIGDIYVDQYGALTLDTRSGDDTDQHIEIRTEDDQFSLVLRDGAGVQAGQPYGNIYVTDNASNDYLTITVNSPKDNDALTVTANNRVGVGVLPGATGAVFQLVNSSTLAPIKITERSSAPSSPITQDIYLDDGTNTLHGNPGFRRYTGSAFEDLGGGAKDAIKWSVLL